MAAASPIVPLVIGREADALAASAALLARGFHVPAIRPPTVAAGTSRHARSRHKRVCCVRLWCTAPSFCHDCGRPSGEGSVATAGLQLACRTADS